MQQPSELNRDDDCLPVIVNSDLSLHRLSAERKDLAMSRSDL